MDLTLQSKACAGCARAKRKCGKQIPTCGRCESRGIACEYPSATTFHLPPRQPDQSGPLPSAPQGQPPLSTTLVTDMAAPPTAADILLDMAGDSMVMDDLYPFHFDDVATLPSAHSSIHLHAKDVILPWYLDKSSWELDHQAYEDVPPIYSTTVLLDHVEVLKAWQSRWIRTGSSPFIHPNVYRFQIPRCVQDAYTTLSTYLERTPENKTMVARIVEDRVRQLLDDQPLDVEEAGTEAQRALDPFEHLARVHALHVYQTIGLYDGDIRLRHVAETQIPTMNSWLRQMMRFSQAAAAQGLQKFIQPVLVPTQVNQRPSAAGDVCSSSLASLPSSLVHSGVPISAMSSHQGSHRHMIEGAVVHTPRLSQEELEWYGWSFAETIRRTWMAASAIQTVYLTLQVRYAPCPGGSMFTAREGLWEAKTAFAWISQCGEGGVQSGQGVDFVNRTQWGGIFEDRRPEEMDEFTREVLDITYGTERVERWRIKMAASGQSWSR